jgi:ABC-2 type transport system ATP-binding protein
VESGTDVLLTTQNLDEADHLATQVVIVNHGRVIAQGTPTELKSRVGGTVVEVHAVDPVDLCGIALVLEPLGTGPARVDVGTRRVTVPAGDGTVVIAQAVRAFDRKKLRIEDLALRRPTLDEVFLTLTNDAIDGRADT